MALKITYQQFLMEMSLMHGLRLIMVHHLQLAPQDIFILKLQVLVKKLFQFQLLNIQMQS